MTVRANVPPLFTSTEGGSKPDSALVEFQYRTLDQRDALPQDFTPKLIDFRRER